jgi:hypothetical protein
VTAINPSQRRRSAVVAWTLLGTAASLAIALVQATTVLLVNGQTPIWRIIGGLVIYGWLWAPTLFVGLIAGAAAGFLNDALVDRVLRWQAHGASSLLLVGSFAALIRISGILGRPGPDVWWWVYAVVIGISGAAAVCAILVTDCRRKHRHLTPAT